MALSTSTGLAQSQTWEYATFVDSFFDLPRASKSYSFNSPNLVIAPIDAKELSDYFIKNGGKALSNTYHDDIEAINFFGSKGWELVTLTHDETIIKGPADVKIIADTFYFKRALK